MTLVKKIPPRVSDMEMQRALQQIYNDLNELVELMGKYQTSLASQTEGTSGTVRVVKEADNSYTISVKTEEGWVNSQTGAFTFQSKS